jgi:hypothetical protein
MVARRAARWLCEQRRVPRCNSCSASAVGVLFCAPLACSRSSFQPPLPLWFPLSCPPGPPPPPPAASQQRCQTRQARGCYCTQTDFRFKLLVIFPPPPPNLAQGHQPSGDGVGSASLPGRQGRELLPCSCSLRHTPAQLHATGKPLKSLTRYRVLAALLSQADLQARVPDRHASGCRARTI